jgi:hypothetical protein
VNVVTIVGVSSGDVIRDRGKTGHGMVTAALVHALRSVRPGHRHSLVGVASRAMQWLRSEEHAVVDVRLRRTQRHLRELSEGVQVLCATITCHCGPP